MSKPKSELKAFAIIWSPEGRTIAKVWAVDAKAAKKQTPAPYKKYMGEVYVTPAESPTADFQYSKNW